MLITHHSMSHHQRDTEWCGVDCKYFLFTEELCSSCLEATCWSQPQRVTNTSFLILALISGQLPNTKQIYITYFFVMKNIHLELPIAVKEKEEFQEEFMFFRSINGTYLLFILFFYIYIFLHRISLRVTLTGFLIWFYLDINAQLCNIYIYLVSAILQKSCSHVTTLQSLHDLKINLGDHFYANLVLKPGEERNSRFFFSLCNTSCSVSAACSREPQQTLMLLHLKSESQVVRSLRMKAQCQVAPALYPISNNEI